MALGPYDRKILNAAADGLSPNEISKAIGGIFTPEQVANRVKDLLAGRDWLTTMEQEQLVVEQLGQMVQGLRARSLQSDTKAIEASMKMLKMKLDYLQKNRVDVHEAARIITEGHARLFLEGIYAVFNKMVDELERRNPATDAGQMHEVLTVVMPMAIESVESHMER